jgi:hypothetical protein
MAPDFQVIPARVSERSSENRREWSPSPMPPASKPSQGMEFLWRRALAPAGARRFRAIPLNSRCIAQDSPQIDASKGLRCHVITGTDTVRRVPTQFRPPDACFYILPGPVSGPAPSPSGQNAACPMTPAFAAHVHFTPSNHATAASLASTFACASTVWAARALAIVSVIAIACSDGCTGRGCDRARIFYRWCCRGGAACIVYSWRGAAGSGRSRAGTSSASPGIWGRLSCAG